MGALAVSGASDHAEHSVARLVHRPSCASSRRCSPRHSGICPGSAPVPYIAEPKLDGQRAQVHVARGRTVHVFSRPGNELLRHPGFAFLRELEWPVDSTILDGEAVAGDGHEGVQSVFAERGKVSGAMAFGAFDVLHVGGQDVMREPWRDRRKRLEDLVAGGALPGVTIVPTTEDVGALWHLWVTEGGGEGIVLKEPGRCITSASGRRPGSRSRTGSRSRRSSPVGRVRWSRGAIGASPRT